jgi:outer membrane autotransporter protein
LDGTTYTFTANNVTVETVGTSYGIVPVFGYDVTESFRPFAKVGVHRWDFDATLTSSAGNATFSDSGTDVMFGAGFTYKFYKNMALRAEFERYTFGDNDVDLISVSAQYTF